MSALATPIDIAEYRRIAAPQDGWYELHHGVLVKVTRPSHKHYRIQQRLVELLRPFAQDRGFVGAEVAFRAEPDYELRAADVAFVESARWNAVPLDDNLHGSPELVIEGLSPSNSVAEMEFGSGDLPVDAVFDLTGDNA